MRKYVTNYMIKGVFDAALVRPGSDNSLVCRARRLPSLRRWRAGLIAAFFLLGACGAGTGGDRPGIGVPLPEVTLTSLAAGTPTSTEALRGVPLVINFWATWCAPCRSEMPGLERLSRRIAPHRVRVIGITVDHDLNLAREFARALGLTFPIFVDGDGKTLQTLLRVKALPETVLVSADGAIVARIAGVRDWDGAEGARLLEHAFKLRPAAVP